MLLGSRSAIRRVSDSSSCAFGLFTPPILRDGSSQVSQSAPAPRPDEQTRLPCTASIRTLITATSVKESRDEPHESQWRPGRPGRRAGNDGAAVYGHLHNNRCKCGHADFEVGKCQLCGS